MAAIPEDVEALASPDDIWDRIPVRSTVFVAGVVAILAAFVWDYVSHGPTDPTVMGWDFTRLDWLFIVALLATTCYGVWPLAKSPELTMRRYRRLRARPLGFAAGLFLLALFLVGTAGPLVLPDPSLHFQYSNQPPVFVSINSALVGGCVNPQGSVCAGSWRFPLGTTADGMGILTMVVIGSRLVVEMGLIAVVLLVPLATIVGSTAAMFGGRLERAVTGAADIQRSVPALFVFLVYRAVVGKGALFMLVVIFGLVNAGRVTSIVHARAEEELSRNYIDAALSAGAGRLRVVREHLVPNVSHTALSAGLLQVPMLIILEATFTYLKASGGRTGILTTPPTLISWGRLIARGMEQFMVFWWRPGFPILAILLTVAAINVFGESLRAVLSSSAG